MFDWSTQQVRRVAARHLSRLTSWLSRTPCLLHLADPRGTMVVAAARAVVMSVRSCSRVAARATVRSARADGARLERVQAIADVALAHRALDDLLRALLDRLIAVLRIDTAAIFLFDGDGQSLRLGAGRGFEADSEPGPRSADSAFALRVGRARAAVIVDDVSTDDVLPPHLLTRGVRSLLGVPLVSGGRTLGVLRVGATRARAFAAADAVLAELVAPRIAVAVEHASAYEAERAARAAADAASAAKDEFLAAVSHELRTPLSAVLTWARLLRGARLDDATRARALDTIDRNLAIQRQLVDDLLDVSRIVTGKVQVDLSDVDLGVMAMHAIEAIRPAAEAKGIRIRSRRCPGALVRGDVNRLQQVIGNLLSNAVKATPSGGAIVVSVRCGDGHARVTVADTGEGIDAALLPHVFDRFKQGATARGRDGGLGLGLAIARHLVSVHGGHIEASSAGRGLGATFVVTLPLAERRQRATARPGAPEVVASALDGVHALLVDDDRSGRDAVATVLRDAGCRVSVATCAAHALSLLSREQVDVLVANVEMRGLVENARRIHAAARRVAAIALGSAPHTAAGGGSAGSAFDMHLAKPVSPADLVGAVATVMGRRCLPAA